MIPQRATQPLSKEEAAFYDEAVEVEDEEWELAQEGIVYLKDSEFAEFSFRMPYEGEYKPFSFERRRYLKQVYNTPAKRKILMAGRQVEKSTYLGNQCLTYSIAHAGFRSLYVSPSNTQTKVFSRDRIKEPIDTSEFLQQFTNTKLVANVLEKKFVNRSQITLRFAFLNADRCRGIPADLVIIDEYQDIIMDSVPVIEECASHSAYKLFTYAGTPKSMDNPIEYYFTRYSTQNEWVVPCRSCGTPKDRTTWHWNILDEDNIGRRGLICDRCRKLIDADDDDAQWASLNPNPTVDQPLEGFRIPQLMVPWVEWGEILHKQKNYPRAKFYNEVLGRSYDSGTRPLTRTDVQNNCNPKLSMSLRRVKEIAQKYVADVPFFMGLDWGTGENTYTVMCLGAYLPFDPEHFTAFYWHRFLGPESEPRRQIEIIKKFAMLFHIKHFGADYGGGFDRNDTLHREYGAAQYHKYQYVGMIKKKIRWEPGLGIPRYLLHRSEIMSDVFNAIKRLDVFRFPRWKEFHDPYAIDFLNIFSEYNEVRRVDEYKHAPGMPDDSFHALVMCFLASMHIFKRPDVILPTSKEAQVLEDALEDLDVL